MDNWELEVLIMGRAADGSITTDEDLWDQPSCINILATRRDKDEEIIESIDLDIPIQHGDLAWRLRPVIEQYLDDIDRCPPDLTPDEWLALQYEADAKAAALENEDVYF